MQDINTTRHAHHFLTRLDRLSVRHVELALTLYRDEELLRFALAHVRLPRNAQRVAISLEHPEEGPFVLVTREGRFVTCLGAGMHQHHPVITRAQLDGAFACIALLRGQRLASIRPRWSHGPDPHAHCWCGSGRRQKRCCGDRRHAVRMLQAA